MRDGRKTGQTTQEEIAALYGRHYQMVLQTAFRITTIEEDAEEILQDIRHEDATSSWVPGLILARPTRSKFEREERPDGQTGPTRRPACVRRLPARGLRAPGCML